MEHGGEGSNTPNKRFIIAQSSEAGDINIPNHPANDEMPDEMPERTYMRSSDQYLPLASVTRIMRTILPPNARIADDAKETIQECVSEFINVVTTEAKENCRKEHRKIIAAEDLLSAMGALGFTDYIEPLTAMLNKHRMQGGGPLVGRPLSFIRPYGRASQAQSSAPQMQGQDAASTMNQGGGHDGGGGEASSSSRRGHGRGSVRSGRGR